MSSTSDNKATVRRIYGALSRGDQSEFARAVHPDYVWRLAGRSSWSRRFEGRETIQRELLGPLFSLFATRYTAKMLTVIADGDRVVAEVLGEVQLHGGERYDNEYCFVFRFRNGLIVELTEYCDTDLIERVLGPYENARSRTQG